MNEVDSTLAKTDRIVLQVSPPMKAALKEVGRLNCLTVSDLIRQSIIRCVNEQYPQFEEIYLAHDAINLPKHTMRERTSYER